AAKPHQHRHRCLCHQPSNLSENRRGGSPCAARSRSRYSSAVIFAPRCNWLRILIGGGGSANTRVRQLQLVGHGVAEAPVIDCRKAALGARTVIACQQSVDPGVGCLIEAVRLKPKLDCWRKGRRCSAATFGSRGDAARDFLANSPAAMTADE